MQDMKEKTVIITGGGRGQGLVEAQMFAERGASVAICDILDSEGEQAARELASKNFAVRYFHLDVVADEEWKATVAAVMEWTGRIDVLVNNAGILKRKTILTYSESDWREVLDVNLTGTFLGVQNVAPHMCRQQSGVIINIASNAAFSGHPDAAYTASKWGVRGLTKSAAMEFASYGVRVNSVCPGLVVTDINRHAPHLGTMIGMTPLGRAVEAEEIAATVLFLAGDGARMITGEEIVVDGGFTAGANYWKVAQDSGAYEKRLTNATR